MRSPEKDINYVPGKKDPGVEFFRYRTVRLLSERLKTPRKVIKQRHKSAIVSRVGVDFDEYDKTPSKAFVGRYLRVAGIRKSKLKKFLAEESKSLGQTYKAYLKSDKWDFFRRKIIAERGAMCERCGELSPHLNVHHLTYVRLGNELPDDVKVYCLPCHKLMHPGWA